jgi:hypothetical protein
MYPHHAGPGLHVRADIVVKKRSPDKHRVEKPVKLPGPAVLYPFCFNCSRFVSIALLLTLSC